MQLWLAPESSRRFEFPRLSSMPKHVFIMDNPYLQSILYDVMLPPIVNAAEDSSQGGNAHQSAMNPAREEQSSLGPSRRQAFISDSSHSAYKVPYRMARLAESIIESITPSHGRESYQTVACSGNSSPTISNILTHVVRLCTRTSCWQIWLQERASSARHYWSMPCSTMQL